MRTVRTWWQTWLTSAAWWLPVWCPPPLRTLTSLPRQRTRRCVAAALDWSSTGKVEMEKQASVQTSARISLCIVSLLFIKSFHFLVCVSLLQGCGASMPRGRRLCTTWSLWLIRLCFLGCREDHTTTLLQVSYFFPLWLSNKQPDNYVSSIYVRFVCGWLSSGVAVALKQAMTPEFRAYQVQVLVNCKALSSTLIDFGYKIVTGTRHTAPWHLFSYVNGIAVKGI